MRFDQIRVPIDAQEVKSPTIGRAFRWRDEFFVMISLDEMNPISNEAKWHLSISRKDRYPTWDEIKDARYAFLPGIKYMAQILPPENEYVNIHNNCFHLWELD